MEKMENNQPESPVIMQPTAQLQITPEAVSFLATTAKWTKFLAILGFIISGFLLLAGIVVAVFFGAYKSQLENTGMFTYLSSSSIGIIYIVIAVIYILPIIHLNNFSNAMTRAVRSGSTERLTYALRNLKRFFKLIGIITIVMLVIYFLIIVLALGAGLFMLGS
jgi:hypothetical protein